MYQPQPPYGPPQQPLAPPKKRGLPTPLLIVLAIVGTCFVGTCLAGAFGRKPEGPSTVVTSPSAFVMPTASAALVPTPTAAPVAPNMPTAVVPAAPVATAAATGESASDAVPRGTAVSIQGLETTLMSARLTRQVSRNFMRHAAPEGATLLVVSYRVRNATTEPIQVTSLADEALASGVTYRPSLECAMAVNTLGVTDVLNPNIPRTFEACFEVPTGVQGFVVKFNRMFTDRFAQTGL